MNSTNEDLPMPFPPTRRMVYGAFALFLDVLIIPFLRDFTSLGNMHVSAHVSKKSCTGNLLNNDFITGRTIRESRCHWLGGDLRGVTRNPRMRERWQ